MSLLFLQAWLFGWYRKNGWRRAEEREIRFEGSYSSIFSRRSKKRWCSVPCDNKYFWKKKHGFREKHHVCNVEQVKPATAHPEWFALGFHIASGLGALVPVKTPTVEILALSEGKRKMSIEKCLSLCLCAQLCATCSFGSFSQELVPLFSPS